MHIIIILLIPLIPIAIILKVLNKKIDEKNKNIMNNGVKTTAEVIGYAQIINEYESALEFVLYGGKSPYMLALKFKDKYDKEHIALISNGVYGYTRLSNI